MRKPSQLVIASATLLLLIASCGCRSNPRAVRIGIQNSPAMALLMVARDKGFFKDEGIDATLQDFTAGKFALQAFLGGSLEFAVSGDVPVTLAMLQGSRFRVIAQVVEKTTNEVRVVARMDGDLNDPGAYFKAKKRKIATSLGGGPEFFTYNFLQRWQIPKEQVEIVSQRPEDMPAALAAGSVDAIAIFDPFAYFAARQMGAKGKVFQQPDIYSELYVLTARQALLDSDPELVRQVLRALVRAQQFIASDAEASKKIVGDYTQLDHTTLNQIWADFVFVPSLTPELLQYQNDEAQWARANGAVPAGAQLPDFKQAIDSAPLKDVAPGAVKIGP